MSQKFCLTGDSLIYNVKIRDVMAEKAQRVRIVAPTIMAKGPRCYRVFP